MLVYANRLQLHGIDSETVVFKAIGGWLKEQLGFGLHPDQLLSKGEYKGQRGKQTSRLRIFSCYDGEPALCAWVLKHVDDDVWGRQWTVEIGVKKSAGTLEVSCVVKVDHRSTLVSSPVSASQPRVIQYMLDNVASNRWDAAFVEALPGQVLRTVGEDRDSYRALLYEIERPNRDAAIVLVTTTREGDYLINPSALQRTLFGLAQVVQVLPGSDTWELAEVVGRRRSAFHGAVNVLSIPPQSGDVRTRLFLPDEIHDWGEERHRISQVLAWVTGNTNLARLREHVQPEGVRLLSTRRRMARLRAVAIGMKEAELREALIAASKEAEEEQERVFEEFVEADESLRHERAWLEDELRNREDELRKKNFEKNALKDQLSAAGTGRSVECDPEFWLNLILQKGEPTPLDCLDITERCHGDGCIVLDSARDSARKSRFINGRKLLDQLIRLVTTYRTRLLAGDGDGEARHVFGRGEYAAKESETVMANPAMRRQRTFDYCGTQVEMFQHLKIGVADDRTQTIRTHFHWDAARRKIVIGHCGEHLLVPSR